MKWTEFDKWLKWKENDFTLITVQSLQKNLSQNWKNLSSIHFNETENAENQIKKKTTNK